MNQRSTKKIAIDRFEDAVTLRLRVIREWKGMNKAEFARSANIPENYWVMFENGTRSISHECARKLKAAFGISLDWLYDGDITDQMPAGLLNQITKKRT